jgi:ADP-ribose diphosphatase
MNEQCQIPILLDTSRRSTPARSVQSPTDAPKLIGKFFSSAGGTSERFFLYFASATETERQARGGGLAGEEDIKVFAVGVDGLFDRLARGVIEDPKLAIGAYWLKDNIDRL